MINMEKEQVPTDNLKAIEIQFFKKENKNNINIYLISE